ncbi:hypothetical protein EZJ43_14500 [Pedobacter changchengzhani]|uniref:Streptomycin biosynthesis protein StrF domain-containing protein n=1 Tax=Pedobacter changchengzhani TaxID=2529274 RepID=A0A4R5MIB8_9SPHI|nr:glycosyltransferase [Pedobacter changchengzhani]TDG35302.1 hypothetical protein EZJ43_14500 [Pedobacter changchengzhani]
MISIIICSRTAKINETLKTNIEKTIGTEYEIIAIDNSANKLSIFEAYNIGVSKSNGSILCFMHDDILFHTQNWGVKVDRHFDNQNIGAIGIAGSPYAPNMPGSWWGGDLINQQLLVKENSSLRLSTKISDGIEAVSKPVAVLDGIWLCIRKSIFDKIKFDSDNFKGYHIYDIDICLQIFKLKYELYCVFDIHIEHISMGDVNDQWIKNALALKKKWKKTLPVQVVKLTKTEMLDTEFKTLKEFSQILIANNYSPKYSYNLALKEIFQSKFGISAYKETAYFLLKYIKSTITAFKIS